MYLFRAANCTYYTRICLPKSLKVRGFPFDIKVSLLTKSRSIAVKRNFDVAIVLRKLIDTVSVNVQVDDFKLLVNQTIDSIRASFDGVGSAGVQVLPVRSSPQVVAPTVSNTPLFLLVDAQAQFIASTTKEQISLVSIKRLK